jgi:hypothetical protein
MPDPQPVQPLSYATFDADGLPDLVPEVEALIDGRHPPRKMRPYFRNAVQTAKYLAKSLRRRKSLENLPNTCEVCGGGTGGLFLPAEWIVVVKPATFEFVWRYETATASFVAHHAICPACLERWVARARRFARLHTVYRVVHWLLFALLMSLFYVKIGPFTFQSHWGLTVVLAYFAMSSVINLLTARMAKRALPAPILDAMPPGVTLSAYHDPAYRERPT